MTIHLNWKHVIALILSGSVIALAGSIKSWSNGEVVTASDLNSNFNHIHNAAEGTLISTSRIANSAVTSSKILDGTITAADIATSGVGTAEIEDGAVVNADISTSAAIAHSKLASPGLVPKMLWLDKDLCGAAACVADMNLGVTSVTGDGSGGYTVVFPAVVDANYVVIITAHTAGLGCVAAAASLTTTGFTFECRSGLSGALTNAALSFVIWDA